MRQFVRTRGHRYVGVDLSKTRVDKNLQQHGGPDLLCDAHFLPMAEEAFDLVYSVNLSEHVACPYLIAQEAARSLKPGGFYLGTGAFLQPWHDDSFFHMSPLGVFEYLTQAKFEIMNIWPGQGYSGFRAIMDMGSKVTRPLTFLGDFMYLIYRTGNKFRNLVKRRPDWKTESIADAARVSGAIDWIARRPQRAVADQLDDTGETSPDRTRPRAFRPSSTSETTKMSRPASASRAPTHPVEAHPKPPSMATPPNHAPIALAMLKAE